PIPDAISPGSSTRGRVGPPSPAASIRMTAPTTGEPKTVASAAKAAAAAITDIAWSGVPFLARLTAKMARPEPSAIRRDSGPTTTPRPGPPRPRARVAGRAAGRGPPALDPPVRPGPPPPGHPDHGDGGQPPRHQHHRQRPPGGHAGEAQPVRNVLVRPLLD